MLGPNMPTWWTMECSKVAKASCIAASMGTQNDKQTLLCRHLKQVMKKAQREWADKTVTMSNV